MVFWSVLKVSKIGLMQLGIGAAPVLTTMLAVWIARDVARLSRTFASPSNPLFSTLDMAKETVRTGLVPACGDTYTPHVAGVVLSSSQDTSLS